MFCVESTVRQLKPEFILHHVLEAEERQWSKVHLDKVDSISVTTASSARSSNTWDHQDPGLVLLRHGISVRKIHAYFSQLEFRKCCLYLSGRKSTFQSLRVVHASSTILDDGSAKRSRTPHAFLTHLEDKDLRAFKHAYLCAAYPVLAAPDPPSPVSPMPSQSTRNQSSLLQISRNFPLSSHDVATQSAFQDSGLEELEDLVFIPSESICSHLQRAFHLTDEKFRDYRNIINKTYIRKSAQVLLAEELAGQLAVLENNCHPFYKPDQFLPPKSYDLWRKAEYDHITELLGKFWHYSLPLTHNAQDLISELHTVHEDYSILLKKLLLYERDFHHQAEADGGMLVSPLSSASARLLKEFGLRYGIGEQFRRILYLDQISADFSPSPWYLQHVLSVISSVLELFPPKRHALAIVKKEYDILNASLLRLAAQTSKALEQMKSLFPNNKPAGGIELLIMVLQRVREMCIYLQTSSLQEEPHLHTLLTKIVQGMFSQTYEKCKTVVRTELRHTRSVHICPRMLNAMIMEMRNEVLDYRNNFEVIFKRYFDITVMAATTFYSLLMKDVETLCQQEKLTTAAIDLRMLALVHRLNQLDHDWSAYIKPQDQKWRWSFQTHVTHWGVALRFHAQDLVLETIAGDAFVTQQLQLPDEGSPLWTSSSSSSHAIRSIALTPSANSAFSSVATTPRQDYSLDNPQLHGMMGRQMVSSETHTSTNIASVPHSTSLCSPHAMDFLSFADKRRHCASLPVFSHHPAIVRVISEVKMSDRLQEVDLHSTAGMEDLTVDDNSITVNQVKSAISYHDNSEELSTLLKGSSPVINQSKQQERYILDSVSDYDELNPPIMEIGDCANSEIDSDSPDITYPPLDDVTYINLTDSNKSYSESNTETFMAKDKQLRSNVNQRAGFLHRVLQGKQVEENLQGQERSFDHALHAEVLKTGRYQNAGSKQTYQQSQNYTETDSSMLLNTNKQVPNQTTQVNDLPNHNMVYTESDHPFLQSLQSTMSFPTPSLSSEAIIPVSGSTIDLLVLLQRVLGFSHTLCKAIFLPLLSIEIARNSGGEAVNVGEADEGSEAAALRSVLETSQANTHLNIVEVLCQAICIYADNMLCLDLCAVPKDTAKRIVGSTLVDHAINQRNDGRIWGCRHQLEGHFTCYAFSNPKASYLSERYEPITQKMCVRINNVMACQEFLKWCEGQTEGALTDFMSPAGPQAQDLNGCPNTGFNRHGLASNFSDSSGLKQQFVEQTNRHLMSVWTALCRLLAFRVNLFLRDGLTLLLNVKPADVSISVCLLPLTTFLHRHLDALSSWLYSHSFRRVMECLWVYIVQDIEVETHKLLIEKGNKLSPHTLLQALMHLMRFMNNGEKGITRDLLLAQSEDVVTKLQLFTLSTVHLIALYHHLAEMCSEKNPSVQEECKDSTVPVRALHQLQRDLQTRHKCFSGTQLVAWIMHNADLFLSPDELSLCGGEASISSQGAIALAQKLLDQQLIASVEAENSVHSISNSMIPTEPYPEVSIHDQLHTGVSLALTSSPLPGSHTAAASCSQTSSTQQDTSLLKESSADHTIMERVSSSKINKIIMKKSKEISEYDTVSSNRSERQVVENPSGKILDSQTVITNRPERVSELEQDILQDPAVVVTCSQPSARQLINPGNAVAKQSKPVMKKSDFEDSGVAEEQECIHSEEPEQSLTLEVNIQGKAASKDIAGVSPQPQISTDTGTTSSPSPQTLTPHTESVCDLDMTSNHSTPMSYPSLSPFQLAEFDCSSKKFYFIPPKPLLGYHWHPQDQATANIASFSQLDYSLLHVMNSVETCSLAEKCFNLKISPLATLLVLYGRRKLDDLAHKFLEQLPLSVLEQISSAVKLRDTECSVL